MNDLSRVRGTRRSSAPAEIPPWVRWVFLMCAAVLALILAVTWLANLEHELPGIRTPRDLGSSTVLPGHALMMPGTSNIDSVDADLSGDWVSQEIGELDWLATDLEGSRFRSAFYGTEIYLLARMGPDASRAYVSVNERPVEHLARDEFGSYVNLWASETSDQPVLLASNLAHGEHVVEVVASGDGELAIAGFEVAAATPFSWAFLLAYAGLSGGLFVAVRSILYAANQQSSAVISGRSSRAHNSVR